VEPVKTGGRRCLKPGSDIAPSLLVYEATEMKGSDE